MNLEETLKTLRNLNEEVPKPMRLPSSIEVEKLEKELGYSFHPDYKLFLLTASDVTYGVLEPATALLDDPRLYLLNIAKEAWGQGLDSKLLPICEDNSDYYCMNESGQVIYWSHNGQSDEKWSSLSDWIQKVWIGEE